MASSEQMPAALAGSLFVHLKIFKIIGLDFLGNPCLVYRFRYVWFVVLLLLFYVGQLLYLYKSDELGADFLDIANAIPLFLLGTQGKLF